MRIFAVLSVLLGLAFFGTAGQSPSTAPAGLAGKWHFVFDTSDGTREFEADFAVADGKVTGTFGRTKDEVKGTAAGEKFDLEFQANSDEAGKGMLKILGKMANDQLSGTWSFQTYDGTFKAMRPKSTDSAGDR